MKIFLSYSTPIRSDQTSVLEQVEQTLKLQNIMYEKLKDAPIIGNPIFTIIDAIRLCDSMICLAFEKYSVSLNGEKHYYTSQWLDIEIALALQLRIPTLIISEIQIDNTPLITHADSPCKGISLKSTYHKDAYQIDVAEFENIVQFQLEYWLNNLQLQQVL